MKQNLSFFLFWFLNLSIVNYQLSIINYQLKFYFRLSFPIRVDGDGRVETGSLYVMQDASIERVFLRQRVRSNEGIYLLRETDYAVLRRLVQVARLGIILANLHEMHLIIAARCKEDEE